MMAQSPNPDFPRRDPPEGTSSFAWTAIPLALAVAVLGLLVFAMGGNDQQAQAPDPAATKSVSTPAASPDSASTGTSTGESGSATQPAPTPPAATPPAAPEAAPSEAPPATGN